MSVLLASLSRHGAQACSTLQHTHTHAHARPPRASTRPARGVVIGVERRESVTSSSSMAVSSNVSNSWMSQQSDMFRASPNVETCEDDARPSSRRPGLWARSGAFPPPLGILPPRRPPIPVQFAGPVFLLLSGHFCPLCSSARAKVIKGLCHADQPISQPCQCA